MFWRDLEWRGLLSAVTVLALGSACRGNGPPGPAAIPPNTVEVWLTSGDLSTLLQQQPDLVLDSALPGNGNVIVVDSNITYQRVFGLGTAFPDSSAYLIHTMLPTAQSRALMAALFDPNSGIKLDLLRLPMGASDFSHVGNYSYDDNGGAIDTALHNFSIQPDLADIVPTVKAAIALNPALKVLATPWSPPGWMKANGQMIGSNANNSLVMGGMAVLAQYFVKFVAAYAAQNIPIWAVTPQNEPEFSTAGYPCMGFPASDESVFINAYLAPAFAAAGLATKVIGFDHNYCDDNGTCPNPYPTTLVQSASSPNALYGIAWHCYAGDISAMTTFHNANPNVPLFLTECSSGTFESSTNNPIDYYNGALALVIDSLQNWSQATFMWPAALDPNGGPTNNGCIDCRGMVTVAPDTGTFVLNPEYYAFGHASKFLWPGAIHIAASDWVAGLHTVALKNTDGSMMLLLHNTSTNEVITRVQSGVRGFNLTLPASSTVTARWNN